MQNSFHPKTKLQCIGPPKKELKPMLKTFNPKPLQLSFSPPPKKKDLGHCCLIRILSMMAEPQPLLPVPSLYLLTLRTRSRSKQVILPRQFQCGSEKLSADLNRWWSTPRWCRRASSSLPAARCDSLSLSLSLSRTSVLAPTHVCVRAPTLTHTWVCWLL